MKIRVADYIIQFLEQKGTKHAFTVTGGGAMFLNDALAKSKQIETTFNHHEQACAMAAVGYSKVNNQPALVMTTTGCGGTNAITGLLDAWQDSNKVFFISGNVNSWETTNPGDGLRKKGVQEADIINIVKSITKYSYKITNLNDINFILNKAWEVMNSKRPGPVWLDVPMDIQGAIIETDEFKTYLPDFPHKLDKNHLEQFESYLKSSKRPIVIAGNGIKLSGSEELFKQFIEKYNLPVVCTYLTIDLLPSNHPNYVGRLGTKGDRAGNFALQNSDLVISLGSSLSIPVTGFKYDTWAREAKKFVVDIDSAEHSKDTVKIDYLANCDLKQFLEEANKKELKLEDWEFPWKKTKQLSWLRDCIRWRDKWNIENEPHKQSESSINIYIFLQQLSKHNKPDAITITDAGSAYYVVSQALKIKDQQKFICSGAQAEMGFALPAAIGVAKASNSKNIIVVTGDGSFQMNIQELQTIKHYNLPIKIFVLNNGGYLSIKNTQNRYFEGRHFGVDEKSGVSFPSLSRIANAYGIGYGLIENNIEYWVKGFLSKEEPMIIEVICSQNQEIIPTVTAKSDGNGKFISQPLENMYPFLSEEEFKKEMIIKPL